MRVPASGLPMPDQLQWVWKNFLRSSIAVLLLLLVYHHGQIVTAPVPLDLYEGTMPLATSIISEGGNPYAREFQPHAADVYPPLYNILMVPITQVFGNSLQLHRAFSALLIFASCLLCYFTCLRASKSKSSSAAAAVLLYAALLFYGTPVASTNALGVFLFLAGLWLPWMFGFSSASLVFALVCGLLGFYAKQYFLLGPAILCLYLFVCVSYRKGLLLGVAFAISLGFSLIVVHQSSPYFLDNTFFVPRAAAAGLQSTDILLLQLKMFLLTYAGLFALITVVGIQFAREQQLGCWRGFLSLGEGRLFAQPVDFFWFSLFWATFAIVLMLGRNPGNYMTYLFQLMSPFFLVAVFSRLPRLSGSYQWAAPLVLVSFFQAYTILPKDFSVDMEKWDRVNAIIADSEDILASQMLLMSLMDHGKDIHQSGHTFYFSLGSHKPDFFRKTEPEDRTEQIWQEYIESLYRKIEQRKFDAIIVSPWEMRGIFERNPPPFTEEGGREFLARYYHIAERFPLSMTDRYGGGSYNLQIWRPIHDRNSETDHEEGSVH
jgi:hypothetical protein